MNRLHYLDEHEIRSIAESLTRDLFPGTPAFRLAGAEGAARLESALAQPRWAHHRTAQRKAAALHYSLNKNHPYVDGVAIALDLDQVIVDGQRFCPRNASATLSVSPWPSEDAAAPLRRPGTPLART